MTERLDSENLLGAARKRVQSDEALAPYDSIIMGDWPNEQEHLEWVLSATTEAIVNWADAIKQNMDDEAKIASEDAERYQIDYREEMTMAQYDGWEITTEFLGGNLFSENDPDIDQGASTARYAELLQAAIEHSYPGATVEVNYEINAEGASREPRVYNADGDPDDDEAASVGEIGGRVFEEGQWYVEYAKED